MKQKTIAIIIIIGLLLGVIYGQSVDPNHTPLIIQPNPPFELGASTTSHEQNIKTSTLPSIMAKPGSQSYLYLKTNVPCTDINIYALDNNQTTAEVEPIKVITGQNSDCNQTGNYIDTQLTISSDQTIVLESDSKFTYAAYQGVEGDEVVFQYDQIQGGN